MNVISNTSSTDQSPGIEKLETGRFSKPQKTVGKSVATVTSFPDQFSKLSWIGFAVNHENRVIFTGFINNVSHTPYMNSYQLRRASFCLDGTKELPLIRWHVILINVDLE
jgi:hypothetical protein